MALTHFNHQTTTLLGVLGRTNKRSGGPLGHELASHALARRGLGMSVFWVVRPGTPLQVLPPGLPGPGAVAWHCGHRSGAFRGPRLKLGENGLVNHACRMLRYPSWRAPSEDALGLPKAGRVALKLHAGCPVLHESGLLPRQAATASLLSFSEISRRSKALAFWGSCRELSEYSHVHMPYPPFTYSHTHSATSDG